MAEVANAAGTGAARRRHGGGATQREDGWPAAAKVARRAAMRGETPEPRGQATSGAPAKARRSKQALGRVTEGRRSRTPPDRTRAGRLGAKEQARHGRREPRLHGAGRVAAHGTTSTGRPVRRPGLPTAPPASAGVMLFEHPTAGRRVGCRTTGTPGVAKKVGEGAAGRASVHPEASAETRRWRSRQRRRPRCHSGPAWPERRADNRQRGRARTPPGCLEGPGEQTVGERIIGQPMGDGLAEERDAACRAPRGERTARSTTPDGPNEVRGRAAGRTPATARWVGACEPGPTEASRSRASVAGGAPDLDTTGGGHAAQRCAADAAADMSIAASDRSSARVAAWRDAKRSRQKTR